MKINSSNQFQPTKQSVQKILSFYSYTLQSFEVATSGIENTTLIVTCNEGRYALRVYRTLKKLDDHVLEELGYMQFLRANNFSVPAVIKNSAGKKLTKYSSKNAQWQIILMEYVEGIHVKKYSPRLIQNLASTQARMHQLGSNYTNRFQGAVLRNLRERYFAKNVQPRNTELAEFLKRVQKFKVKLDESLPYGLCHLDYDKHNILVNEDDDITGIIDFDDLALAPYVIDLGYSAWDVFYFGSIKDMELYIKEYEKVRPLSELERSSLKSILLFRHYVVCTIFAADDKDDDDHISKYLACEQKLHKWTVPHLS